MRIFAEIRNRVRAWFAKYFRTREVLKVFKQGHAYELIMQPMQMWPMIQARQSQEIDLIKAGKLTITDRKSWAWPFMPSSIYRMSTPVMKCYSADTEILTKRGWIYVPEMQHDDQFAVLTEYGGFKWERATDIFAYRYAGSMCHFDNKGVDILVTPTHRMYGRQVAERLNGKTTYSANGFVQARDIAAIPRKSNGYGFQIPLAAQEWKGTLPSDGLVVHLKDADEPGRPGAPCREYSIALSDYVALLGIWLAEGSSSGACFGIDNDDPLPLHVQAAITDKSEWVPRIGEGYQINIAQSDTTKRKKIEELLARTPFKWHPKGDALYVCTSKALWNSFAPLGNKYTKRIPDWVKDLPQDFLQLLVDWMVLGDGHIYKKQHPSKQDIDHPSFQYDTASAQLADDFTEILQKLGIGSYIYNPKPHNRRPSGLEAKHGDSPFYSVRAARLTWVGLAPPKQEDYDGYVYCPSVPSEIVLVRRNGKVAWCGNTLPYNLRRMSRTPVPRRAMNLIKNDILNREWEIRAIDGTVPLDDATEQAERIKITTAMFERPNNEDSFQSWGEKGLEDFLLLGSFVSEMKFTPDPMRPMKMWAVNTESVRIFISWAEDTPDMPRYAQMTGLKGERGAILFYDDELLYIKDNESTDNPFGLGKMEVAFQCYSEDTEVLTKRGWVAWPSVHEDDLLATRNVDGFLVWHKPESLYKYRCTEPLIHFKTQSTDVLVTKNHRMYGWKTDTLKFYVDGGSAQNSFYRGATAAEAEAADIVGFMRADEVAAIDHLDGRGMRGSHPFRVPAHSLWRGRIPKEYADGKIRIVVPDGAFGNDACNKHYEVDLLDWIRFIGLYVAEGSCCGCSDGNWPEGRGTGNGGGGRYGVQISQAQHSKHFDEISNLLERLPWQFNRYPSSPNVFDTADKALHFAVRILGSKYEKYVPQWIKDLPPAYIEEFIEWAMKGDGTVRPDGQRVYGTCSKRLADDMQELFQKIGTSARIRTTLPEETNKRHALKDGREIISTVPFYGIFERHGEDYDTIGNPEYVPYDGFVYCATVPNGTLYVRRNGMPLWCGNCVNDFLGIQRMSGMAGADQIHKTWLWWQQPQTDSTYQIVRRHIQNELEGQAKVSIIGGAPKPEVVEITPVSIDDLLLPWQEMLIRMIANAFDLSAMSLGIEHDVNRAVGQVLSDRDFRSAVVPLALRLQGAFTRQVIHKKLGWTDLEFAFIGLEDPDKETLMDINARLYSTNAITPNGIRKSMGMEPIQSPFAEMTQMESMIIMAQVTGMVQDQNANNAFGRQVAMMQISQGGPPDQGPPDDQQQPEEGDEQEQEQQQQHGPPQQGGGGGKPAGPPKFNVGAPGTGTVKLPKMALTQFPTSGTQFTAADIANMDVDEISDHIQCGRLPKARRLLRDIKAQDPSILEQMSDEVRQFLEDLAEEEKQPQPKTPTKVVEQWRKDQGKKMRQQNSRLSNYSAWLYQTGGMTYRGKPIKNVGVPGKPPDVTGP